MRRLLLCLVAVATLASWAVAAPIPVLNVVQPLTGDANSDVVALTPDGVIAAGQSWTGTATRKGIVWDAVNASRQPTGSVNVTGVGYRNIAGVAEVAVWGTNSANATADYPRSYHTIDYGPTPTWTTKGNAIPSGSGAAGLAIGGVNSLAVAPDGDSFFVVQAGTQGGNNYAYVSKGTGRDVNGKPTYAVSTFNNTSRGVEIRSVNPLGRAVGRLFEAVDSGQRHTAMYDWDAGGTSRVYVFNTLNNYGRGECWGINADGSMVAGWSPEGENLTGARPYVHFPNITTPGTPGAITFENGPTYKLPYMSNAIPVANVNTGITTMPAVFGYGYGVSADGHYVVGMNYEWFGAYSSTTGEPIYTERAVLWTLPNLSDPSTWTVMDLNDWASNLGLLSANGLSRLSRARSVTVDGNGNVWVAGQAYDANSFVRGYTLMLPEPTTLGLLALGGLLLVRRRR